MISAFLVPFSVMVDDDFSYNLPSLLLVSGLFSLLADECLYPVEPIELVDCYQFY